MLQRHLNSSCTKQQKCISFVFKASDNTSMRDLALQLKINTDIYYIICSQIVIISTLPSHIYIFPVRISQRSRAHCYKYLEIPRNRLKISIQNSFLKAEPYLAALFLNHYFALAIIFHV